MGFSSLPTGPNPKLPCSWNLPGSETEELRRIDTQTTMPDMELELLIQTRDVLVAALAQAREAEPAKLASIQSAYATMLKRLEAIEDDESKASKI